MNVEERLHRMMSNVGGDVADGAWTDFLSTAHRRHTRYRVVTAFAIAAAVVAAGVGTAAVLNMEGNDLDLMPADRNIVPAPIPVDVPTDCPTPGEVSEGSLGTVAYLGATELHVVDVATGDDEILVQGGPGFGEGFFAGEVRISPDGRWVSFGMGYVVPTSGGGVCAPLGVGVGDLQWTPDGTAVTPDGTAVALRSGSLVVGGWQKEAVAASSGAHDIESFALSPNGAAIAASVGATDDAQEIWVIESEQISPDPIKLTNLGYGGRIGVEIAGWDPTGQWVLFWNNYPNSESLNADGGPLRAVEMVTGNVRTITDTMVNVRDQMTWCGETLVFTDGGGRSITDTRVIAATQPPLWEKAVLQGSGGSRYVHPACDGSGREFAAIEVLVDGVGLSDLVRWAEGGDAQRLLLPPQRLEPLPSGALGLLHPQLSKDGSTVVVEAMMHEGESTTELIAIDDEDTRTLGILGVQSSDPLVGGAPMWDWHRP